MGLEEGSPVEMGSKMRDSGLPQPPDSEASPQGFYPPVLWVPPEGEGRELSGTQMSPLSPKSPEARRAGAAG